MKVDRIQELSRDVCYKWDSFRIEKTGLNQNRATKFWERYRMVSAKRLQEAKITEHIFQKNPCHFNPGKDRLGGEKEKNVDFRDTQWEHKTQERGSMVARTAMWKATALKNRRSLHER